MENVIAFPKREPLRFSFRWLPFLGMQVAPLLVFITGISWRSFLLVLALYAVRMLAISAGYHRLFAHRSYRTSRVFQFIIAVIGCTAAQKGPLWWAAHHRTHHAKSDEPGDLHSPRQNGFWYAHAGWFLHPQNGTTDLESIEEFARYPELRFLNNWAMLPAFFLALGCLWLLGWQGLSAFFISTFFLYHGTFAVNSLSHVWGSRRYVTKDDSRNNFLIALWTSGEGWHNNHHHYQASVRQGFFWWQVDFSFYVLKALSWFRLVWNLTPVPTRLLWS